MESPSCPNCNKDFVRRAHRQGPAEVLFSLFYLYPFRCQLCTQRFLALQWGYRYKRYTPDRREYLRIPVRVHAAFLGEASRGEGTAADLSMRGCALATDTRPAQGEVLRLKLDLQNGRPETIEVEAAVVRNVVGRQYGLEFLRIHSQEKEQLGKIIEHHLHSRPMYQARLVS